MESKDIFFSLGIILSFILGVWNIVNNYRASRRTSFINTVTSERVKWIENLRSSISTFCGLTYTWSMSNLEGSDSEKEVIKEIDKLRHYIRLQLNPSSEAILDRKIENLIIEIPNLTHEVKESELKESLNELIVVSQELLKGEWDKVKQESKQGDLKENEHCFNRIFGKLNNWCLKITGK